MENGDIIISEGEENQGMPPARRKYAPEESRRMVRNVFVISIAFMVLFTATGSMSNLQSSLNPEDGLGMYSRACGYASMVFSSMFISTFLIQRYTVKLTLTVTMFISVVTIIAQFYPRFVTMIPASIIGGLVSAPFWSAKCTYLTHVGEEYAHLVGEKSDVVITRFFGIFFLIFQSHKVWGNLIATFVLANDKVRTNETTKDISVCGNNFCPANAQDSETIEKVPMWRVYTLAGIYLGVAMAAVLIAALFIDSLIRYGEKRRNTEATFLDQLKPLVATLRLMKNPLQILIIPLTVWSGLEQGFYSADFYQAYVTCAWGIENLGYVAICYGLCDSIASYGFGAVVRTIGRIPVFVMGALMNLGIILTLFYWAPDPEKPWIFFVVAGVWGTADAIWQTQINAFYGIIFPKAKEAGFSNYRLWESLGFIAAFINGDLLCVNTKLYLLLCVLGTGMVGYFLAEYIHHQKTKNIKTVIVTAG